MNCQACNTPVSKDDLLRCNPCKRIYHFRCLNMSATYFKANKNELITKWYCPSCANITRRKGTDTPVGKYFVQHLNETTMSCDESLLDDGNSASESIGANNMLAETQTGAPSSGMTYVEFLSLLDTKLDAKLDAKFETFRTYMNRTIVSQITSATENLKADFTSTTDFLVKEQQDLKKELTSANNTISRLESEKAKLQSEFIIMERRITSLEKVSRSRNLEIQAVPDRRNEDTLAIVKKICNTIKVPIQDSDICAVRRIAKIIPGSSRPRNILVTLPSERHRDVIISAYKRYNKNHRSDPLNTALLDVPGEKCTIYLAEHLSAECKELYAAARRFSKEHSYKYVWVKYSRVYLRKDDSSSAIFVRDLPTLSKLKI